MKNRYYSKIREAEKILTDLQKNVHNTFVNKFQSKENEKKWEEACTLFHDQYNRLYFNGISDYRTELRNGNQDAIEFALAFLEIRPYFFRSGYIYKDLMRVLKNCPLNTSQKLRFESILKKYIEYKKIKDNKISSTDG